MLLPWREEMGIAENEPQRHKDTKERQEEILLCALVPLW
jgi:hypothetical protein